MTSNELKKSYAGVLDGRLGFGRRPCVLVVDFIRAYTSPGSPLYAPAVSAAVSATGEVLTAARARSMPIIYTQVMYSTSGLDGGLFVRKVPVLRTLVPGAPGAAIVEEIAPDKNDVVITKQYASAFFGTPLASMLTASGIDTVILTGCSTSGCIRATAVDSMQYGFRTIVPRECVADRAAEPHEANLFDINSKYGDVVGKSDVLAYLQERQDYRP